MQHVLHFIVVESVFSFFFVLIDKLSEEAFEFAFDVLLGVVFLDEDV